jgi:hypothetical protein
MKPLLKRLKAKDFTTHANFCRQISKLNDNVINSIKSIVGSNNFSSAEAIRTHHAKDESFHRFVLKKNMLDIHLQMN